MNEELNTLFEMLMQSKDHNKAVEIASAIIFDQAQTESHLKQTAACPRVNP